MINFQPITLHDKLPYERCLFADGARGAECSFANLYLWGTQSIAYLDGCAVSLARFGEYTAYHFPIGGGDKRAALDALFADAAERGIPFRLFGIREPEREMLTALYPDRLCFYNARSSHDYVYAIEDLAELKGRRYHGKRNHLYRFQKEHPDYRVLPLEDADFAAVRQMAEDWYTDRAATDPDGDYEMEHRALSLALSDYAALGLEGLVLLDGDEVLALTMGSRLSHDTYDVHFEKARASVEGAYPAINYEFARYIREKHPDVRFLDREEDMGLPSLRRAKESYRPHHMIEKYRAVRRDLSVTAGAPSAEHIPALRALFGEAFGDGDEFLDFFFGRIFSPDNAHCVFVDGRIAAALYFFPCEYRDKAIAYVYAVATDKGYRGQGLATLLLNSAHARLDTLGYHGTLLVPSEPSLFDFYARIGYRTATSLDRLTVDAAPRGVSLKRLTADEYASLRPTYLPQGGVLQGDECMAILAATAELYAGDGFLLAGRTEDGVFHAAELLGDTAKAPAILHTLGVDRGVFRTAGSAHPFSMYRPIDDTDTPTYFGLALD